MHAPTGVPHNISPLLEAVTLISGKPLQSHIDHVASLGIRGQHSQWRDTDSHAGRLWLQSATVFHSHWNKTMRKVTWGKQNGKSPESEEKKHNLSTFNGPKSSDEGPSKRLRQPSRESDYLGEVKGINVVNQIRIWLCLNAEHRTHAGT